MNTDAAHNSWWQISEIIFGIPLLVAIGLQFASPLSLPGGLFRPVFVLVGAALGIAGLALIVLTRREFTKHGENTDPGHPTRRVMTGGVFSFSRNPMYLGIVVFLAGVAIAADLPWLLVLLVPAITACHYILIAPEERYLSSKFGAEYAAYSHSVQRWFGRLQ